MARVSVKITRWNKTRLSKAVDDALKEFGPQLAEQAREEITTRKWPWPGPTLRFESLLMGGKPERGGFLIPAGNRDIVDTGTLLNSQQPPKVQTTGVGVELSITWTAPYAKNVLMGKYDSYINPEGRLVVPEQVKRNWLTSTLEAKPFLPFLVQRWNQLAGQ